MLSGLWSNGTIVVRCKEQGGAEDFFFRGGEGHIPKETALLQLSLLKCSSGLSGCGLCSGLPHEGRAIGELFRHELLCN